ncbi:hypothetical protein NQZ68_011344 [Dissostichus eleginoides]|nr:hypothetical protein NQZ68_011344 [Dissostichus eleginoides]
MTVRERGTLERKLHDICNTDAVIQITRWTRLQLEFEPHHRDTHDGGGSKRAAD